MRELDEDFHPVQLELVRNMSIPQRVQLWNDLTRTVLELRFARLAQEHPGESERELLRRFCAELYGQELAEKAYP